jgi:hypothetical protein
MTSDNIVIRPIFGDAELDHVHRLTHDAYVARGLTARQANGRLRYFAGVEAVPENMVLVATCEDAIVGTVSVTLDGPGGLSVDLDFKAACDAIRAEGPTIGCVWRIVTDPGLRTGVAVVLELIRSAAFVLDRFGVDTALIQLAPRHERVYQRLLGFLPVARTAALVELASPAVLMRVVVAEAVRRVPPHPNPHLAALGVE